MMNASATIFRMDDSYRKSTSIAKSKTGEKSLDNDVEQAAEKLDNLALGSTRIILDIKAVFPFNFFPDEVVLDETKVSIHTNYFFYTKEVRSIEYNDIFNVVIRQGMIFASLEIVDRYFSQEPLVIGYLKKNDAVRARRLIQGMIIAKKENINIRVLPKQELLQKLERIGQTR